MKKLLITLFNLVLFYGQITSQVVDITANPGTSGNVVFGTSNYSVTENIYTETEIGASNFTTPATAINYIAVTTTTVGSPTTFNNIKIYMRQVPLSTTTFTNGTYNTTGYTEVFNGSVTISATGLTTIMLNTPFTRTSGNNLQVMFERTDNVTHPGFVFASANGNHTGASVLSTRRYNGTVAISPSTNLTTSNFRAAIRLAHLYNNDAKIDAVYTLGKVPIPNGSPVGLSARISNVGILPLTNLPVTATSIGANAYSDTQIIPSLAPGASTTVSFATFSPTNIGINNLTVSAPNDDFNANNSLGLNQNCTTNTWSYAYGSTPTGGVGFNGATGDFVAKFNNNAPTSLSQVTVNFSAGGQSYKIGVWDATGAGGTPGSLLWELPVAATSISGANVLPVSPALPIPVGDFFVGVRQIGTTNVSFSYQNESPIRPSTFYFTSPTGGTTWTDFAPNNPFKFMIEPKLIVANDASVSNITTPINRGCFNSPQSYTVLLTNTGLNAISSGLCNLQLKVRGANNATLNATNTNNLVSGATELITFSGIDLSNRGNNLDTVTVTLAGDGESANDIAQTSNFSASFKPFSNESFELTQSDLPYVTIVNGRNLTFTQTGKYSNLDLIDSLAPIEGNRMILFDNYSGASSVGMINRLSSECYTIPSNSLSPKINFYMSHDTTYVNDKDSLFVTVSNDNGATWNRVGNFGRHVTTPESPSWSNETVDLSPYINQTIRVGFEDKSAYGNVITLDKVIVSTDCKKVIDGGNIGVGTLRDAYNCASMNDTLVIESLVDTIALSNSLELNGKTLVIKDNDSSKAIISLNSDIGDIKIGATGDIEFSNLIILDNSSAKSFPVLINNGVLDLINVKISGISTSTNTPIYLNNGSGTIDGNCEIKSN
jgi:hypothetical protein